MKKWARVPAVALAAVLAAAVASPALAADKASGPDAARHDAKIANIRKLVHIMSGRQMKDMMDKMFQSTFRAIEAQMPPDAKEDPEARQLLQDYLKSVTLGEKDLEEMMDLMIPYYDKYLDDADVGALVQFYESPTGKKFVRVMPEMMAEMMPQIMAWTMEKLKGPTEEFRKKLEAIEAKKAKEGAAEEAEGAAGE